MKKFYKGLIVGTALSAAVAVNASAANFTNCADALNQMGLFKGTQTGYELDRTPTRGEAAVMLVRLLGKEGEALEKKYKTPFTDVPAWASDYVGWLYENELTNGVSDKSYGTSSSCSAQMYSTFLLRSLGYSDTGAAPDFTYNTSVDFAAQNGISSSMFGSGSDILRDDVAAMSYAALAAAPKDSEYDSLLDKLVADGAVDSAKAKPYQDKFNLYNEYIKDMEKSQDLNAMQADMDFAMDIKFENISAMTMNMDCSADVIVDMDNFDKSKVALEGKADMKMNGSILGLEEDITESTEIKAYYTDGNYYVNTDGEKLKMPMSLQEVLAGMGSSQSSKEPISSFESITKENGKYKLSYSTGYMNNAVEEALSMVEDMLASLDADIDMAMSVDKVDAVVDVKNGELKGMTMDMACNMDVAGQKIGFDMTMSFDIKKTGSSVTVNFPSDLDTYVDMNSLSLN